MKSNCHFSHQEFGLVLDIVSLNARQYRFLALMDYVGLDTDILITFIHNNVL